MRNFFTESRDELRKVQWPIRKEAIRYTVVVVIASLIIAAFLGGFDYLFSWLLQSLITRNVY